MKRIVRLVAMTCSLAFMAAIGPRWAAATTEDCDEPAQYEGCMYAVTQAYNYCMQQHPGDPYYECFGQRASGEASCWAEYCFIFPEG